jgi:thioesterase domain-containing protein
MALIASPEQLLETLRLMPPARALQLQLGAYGYERLGLHAPLAPNVNDKGCAFGGSLASVLTLTAWGLASLKLGEAGLAAEVYVQDSTVRYLAPLFADLQATAWLDPEQDWPEFVETLRSRGRARARLLAEILLPEGGVACSFEGRFVAKRG